MRLTIDIPDELHRWLKRKAAAEGRTMRALVVDAIERGLARRRLGLPIERKVNPTREGVDPAMVGDAD